MTRIAILMSLVAYSIIVSQPLAYLLFMSRAQRALSAPAYIELRQCINPVMSRRVPVIYLGTLATLLALIALSLQSQSRTVLVTAIAALLCLVVDIVFMLRENVPINGVVDRWSPSQYPADWKDYRDRWFGMFGYRQVVLLVGFFSLLVGAVFQA